MSNIHAQFLTQQGAHFGNSLLYSFKHCSVLLHPSHVGIPSFPCMLPSFTLELPGPINTILSRKTKRKPTDRTGALQGPFRPCSDCRQICFASQIWYLTQTVCTVSCKWSDQICWVQTSPLCTDLAEWVTVVMTSASVSRWAALQCGCMTTGKM